MIWYYLVHDNFFVSGLDWGTIIPIKPIIDNFIINFIKKFLSIRGINSLAHFSYKPKIFNLSFSYTVSS